MRGLWVVAFLALATPLAAAADDGACRTEIEQINEQITEIGQRVRTVHGQLTDLRISSNLEVAVLFTTAIGVLVLLGHLWWRTRRAESEIQVLRRVRMPVRR